MPPDAHAPLSAADQALIAAATDVLLRHYRLYWNTIAAALRSQDGRIWTGIHLGTRVGRMSVCAEPIAFGRALLEGDGTAEAIVALRHPKPDERDGVIEIVSPCAACRELLMDYAPDCTVIVPGPLCVPVRDLLPMPFRR